MTHRPQISHSEDSPAAADCDALVIGAYSDDDSFRMADGQGLGNLDGLLLEALRDAGFKGKSGEVLVVPTLGELSARAIAVVGLGAEARVDAAIIRKAAAAAARRLSERPVVASTLHRALDEGSAPAAEGYLLGSYSFETYKTDPHLPRLRQITFLGGEPHGIERAVIHSEATALARDLVNEPASALTPEVLGQKAQALSDEGSMECAIVGVDALKERGFGGILGVAQGSVNPPCLIEMRYSPQGATRQVSLVGKGVTFDSGGLSIKPAGSMEEMKTDMAGAAAVIATMSALPRLEVRSEVLAFVPAVENMPSGNALRPGDVIRHYGGRTTEVLNTDAEGRLILGDALALASEQESEAIVDVATLTGSIVIALGKKISGLFCTDDALCDELVAASRRAGERLWRMPLHDDYFKDLDSDIADAKNVAGRYGGSIFAALFLKQFVGKRIAWAHLDIAGPARADRDYDEVVKGGSGVATRTLINWIEQKDEARP